MRLVLTVIFFCFTLVNKALETGEKKTSPRIPGFIENKGQFTDDNGLPLPFVLFKTTAPGVDFYITTTGITYVFSRDIDAEEDDKERESNAEKKPERKKRFYTEKIELQLSKANIFPSNITTEGISAHHYNYFLSHIPNGVYDVIEYEKVIVRDIYCSGVRN